MDQTDKLQAFFSKAQPFKTELGALRALAKKTEAMETFKWNSPVYTVDGKNVFGIMGFKNHYGLWFFNGVYLKDPLHVLEAAQESTKALRHWKFGSEDKIEEKQVLAYMEEAIQNQKKGLAHKSSPIGEIVVPDMLDEALKRDKRLSMAFETLAPYKQREFCEYIASAKQEKTKLSRLQKSTALIEKGMSLNDRYR